VPLAARISGANAHDTTQFERMIEAIPPLRHGPGRPRRWPEKLHADKGYDFPKCRQALRRRGITSRIARRGIASSIRLGRHQWVVERTISWLHRFRCAPICWHKVVWSF